MKKYINNSVFLIVWLSFSFARCADIADGAMTVDGAPSGAFADAVTKLEETAAAGITGAQAQANPFSGSVRLTSGEGTADIRGDLDATNGFIGDLEMEFRHWSATSGKEEISARLRWRGDRDDFSYAGVTRVGLARQSYSGKAEYFSGAKSALYIMEFDYFTAVDTEINPATGAAYKYTVGDITINLARHRVEERR